METTVVVPVMDIRADITDIPADIMVVDQAMEITAAVQTGIILLLMAVAHPMVAVPVGIPPLLL